MAAPRALGLVLLTLALAACSGPPPPRGAPPRSGSSSPDELRRNVRLAEAVVVGAVYERLEEAGVVTYVIRVREVLSARGRSTLGDEPPPVAAGETVRVASFLYRPGRPMGEVGLLRTDEAYLFLLARTQRPDEWLNLDDPADYPLPAARDVVEEVRGFAVRRDPGADE